MAGDHLIFPPRRVVSQLNTFPLIGMGILMVADIKHTHVSTSMPKVNIRWTCAMKSKNPMEKKN